MYYIVFSLVLVTFPWYWISLFLCLSLFLLLGKPPLSDHPPLLPDDRCGPCPGPVFGHGLLPLPVPGAELLLIAGLAQPVRCSNLPGTPP